jgi:hypothetical protein
MEKRNAGEPPTVEQAVPDYIASVEKYKSVAERVAESIMPLNMKMYSQEEPCYIRFFSIGSFLKIRHADRHKHRTSKAYMALAGRLQKIA